MGGAAGGPFGDRRWLLTESCGGRFPITRIGEALRVADTIDHFFVMVGQVLDDARIGRVLVRLTLTGGAVVEGVPSEPVAGASDGDEIDDSGYGRWVTLAGTEVDLTAVRQATILHPDSGR